MTLSSEQRRYVGVSFLLIPFVINFVLNGLLGAAMFRGTDPVPIWGIASSAGPDLIGTCFFLPFLTCLIVTALTRRHLRAGIVESLSPARHLPSWLQSFRRPLASRALFFGLAGMVSAGSLVAALLLLAGSPDLGFSSFLWLKASFSSLLGAVVTPLIGIVALAESAPQTHPA